VLTVTLNLHFLCIIGVGTVVAAVGFESRDLALALLMAALVLTTHIENLRHNTPQSSEFVFDQLFSFALPSGSRESTLPAPLPLFDATNVLEMSPSSTASPISVPIA
jgi:hypothetical protein